jgi:hypothetical protein
MASAKMAKPPQKIIEMRAEQGRACIQFGQRVRKNGEKTNESFWNGPMVYTIMVPVRC